MKITPPLRWELIVGACVWLFLAAATLLAEGPLPDIFCGEVLGSSLFALVGLVFAYAEALRRSAWVEIDVAGGYVKLQRRNWLWQPVRENYLLARFGRVRSILAMRGKYPKIWVDLVELDDTRSVTLTIFTPRGIDGEPTGVEQLRQAVAEFSGVTNSGFEGAKFPLSRSLADSFE